MTLPCVALLLLAPAGYARPELLLEPAELAKPEVAKKFVILDARNREAYRAGHVPGAVWVDVSGWAKAFAAGQDPAEWAKRVGALGIDAGTPVVVSDAKRGNDAARVWWILRYWGVKDVRLLNGGWPGWAGVEKGEGKPKPVEAKLTAHPERLATKKQILEGLKRGTYGQILDARSEREYCGTATTAKRNGAIPGAKHLEWSDTVDKNGKFKSAEELTRLFTAAGIDPRKPATTYCQSGGRAAVLAFAVELMGGREVRNYYRSWAEWGNDKETPVVKPKAKK
jgi:thiosulfate/3-mercaptopyruvate sulfurtransferase